MVECNGRIHSAPATTSCYHVVNEKSVIIIVIVIVIVIGFVIMRWLWL